MTMSNAPKAARILGRLLLGSAAVAAVQALAGVLEMAQLRTAAVQAIALAPISSDAERAVSNLDAAAHIAIWVGGLGALVALVAWLLVLRVDAMSHAFAWAAAGVLFFGQFALMSQDSSIGITPFVDNTGDRAAQDLVNSLIVAPGYFPLVYPAEVAALVLSVWVAVLLRGEDTIEYLRSRGQAAADPGWDAMMAVARERNGKG